MKKAEKNIYTTSQALKKAADYCVVQERCQQEIRTKLYDWGIYNDDAEQVIAELISLGFINEERFAKAFAGGKFRMKKWGKLKIKNELKRKNISDYCINKGLQEISHSEYLKALKEIVLKKSKEVKEKNSYKRMNRIISYAIQKGYENDLVWDIAKTMIKE
ncbi:MAG TPA: regulatory protein RecX [Bacteroidales bacterium]|nr:regulatory protein RecX [Bacteroidales bacterium]HPS16466.1 regulatory protein RecX [Bacteroidales bacterium]